VSPRNAHFCPNFYRWRKNIRLQLIRLMHSHGTTVCRSHCNVDPVSKLGNLEHLKASFERFKDTPESKIIIFPQHGLLAANSVGLMREALKSGGVSYVGGVDLASFDHAMEKSVGTTVQLATDFDVGIDIHIHEQRETAIPAFNRIMDHIEKDKQPQGNVTFSHAYSLIGSQRLPDGLQVSLRCGIPHGNLGLAIGPQGGRDLGRLLGDCHREGFGA